MFMKWKAPDPGQFGFYDGSASLVGAKKNEWLMKVVAANMWLLQPLRWCCVDCMIHHKRDVREEQHHTYMWREQAIIEWSWRVISIVACCHSAKLCAHAARDFRSQHGPQLVCLPITALSIQTMLLTTSVKEIKASLITIYKNRLELFSRLFEESPA